MSSCGGNCRIIGSCKNCRVEFCSYGYCDCDVGRPDCHKLDGHKYCIDCYSLVKQPQMDLKVKVKELIISLKRKLKNEVRFDILETIIVDIHTKFLGKLTYDDEYEYDRA